MEVQEEAAEGVKGGLHRKRYPLALALYLEMAVTDTFLTLQGSMLGTLLEEAGVAHMTDIAQVQEGVSPLVVQALLLGGLDPRDLTMQVPGWQTQGRVVVAVGLPRELVEPPAPARTAS